jgi:hypothetical protein
MGCNFWALRYAVTKAEKADGVCGIDVMHLKLGKRSAVVVSNFSLLRRELAVMRTLVNGYSTHTTVSIMFLIIYRRGLEERTYIESRSTFAYHTLQSFNKVASLADLLLDIAHPVLFPSAKNDLFRICGHCIQKRCLAIDV